MKCSIGTVISALACCVAFAFGQEGMASAQTEVPGGIINGETWTSAGSPYRVLGDVVVQGSEGLTIEAGVRVEFDEESGMEIQGILRAYGAEGDSVEFRPADGQAAWKGLSFNLSFPGSELEYCNVSGSAGSGIRINNSPLVIRHSAVRNNTNPTEGAGIHAAGGTPLQVEHSLIVGNSISGGSGTYRGAGIYTSAPLTLIDTVVSDNHIQALCGNCSNAAYGGGVFATADVRLSDCTIDGNDANAGQSQDFGGSHHASGGGIYASSALTMDHSAVLTNRANASRGNPEGRGGGVYAIGMLLARNCRIALNYSWGGGGRSGPGYGGGIYAQAEATVHLYNTILRENESRTRGGGVYLEGGPENLLQNCTVAFNQLQLLDSEGTGVFGGGSNPVKLVNTIVYHNPREGGIGIQLGGALDANYCDIEIRLPEYPPPPGPGNISEPPLFVDDPETGLIIDPISPCVDTGNPDPIYDDLCFPPSRGTGRNDMGAHGGPLACADIGLVDLGVTKIVDDESPGAGQEVTYTVTITNRGPDVCTNVLLKDQLPQVLELGVVSATDGSYEPATGEWSLDSLPSGSTAELTMHATVSPQAAGLEVTNTAQILDHDQVDFQLANDVAQASISPVVPVAFHAFQVQPTADGVLVQWQVPPESRSSFRVSARGEHDQWPVAVERKDATSYVGLDREGPFRSGEITYDLFLAMEDEWLLLDSRSAEVSSSSTRILGVYPNPMQSEARIAFGIGRSSHARIDVYDVAGRRVAVLADGRYSSGRHDVQWTGSDDRGMPVASGVYFLMLTTESTRSRQKILLVR